MTANERRPALAGDRAAEQTTTGGGSADLMVPPSADIAAELGRGDASVIPPSAGRIVTRAVTRCAACGATTVHVFRDVDGINGSVRRGACRHVYRLRVRRVLAQWHAGEAA